jgi:hypothetical protein
MLPPGYACVLQVEPLIIVLQLGADGLWTMNLFDKRGGFRVIMPPSEYGLPAAKEKAVISAEYYMRKYGGEPSWTHPASVDWVEFKPRTVTWET